MDQASHAACQRLPSDDKALAIAIAGDTLRWLSALDELIDSATQVMLPHDSKVRTVLRMALVQLLKLGIAPHAVVATSLALLTGGPRRLAHALLSRAQRENWALPDVPALPSAVVARWRAAWGDGAVEAAATSWCVPPPLDIRFASEELAAAFPGGDDIGLQSRRLARAGRIEALPGYAEGGWWVQDVAAGIAADLFGNGRGRRALDLCAAPGGKTMQLAAAGWEVTAVDISARRLERLADNLRRTGLRAELITADILSYQPDGAFDAVLLDAPCSATGTYRRHPDVLYRITQAEIGTLSKVQLALLERASMWVDAKGKLVFATCSLEPHEGEEVVANFLARQTGWRISAPNAARLPSGTKISSDNMIRTLPGSGLPGGMDGFFIAALERV